MDPDAPVVIKERKKRESKGPGLTARDKNPSAGRDAKAAGERAADRLQVPAPPPLVILPFESTLEYVFKTTGGRETAINAARMLPEDPRMQKIVYAWDTATERDKKVLNLETLCSAAGITPDDFLGAVIPVLWRRNLDIGKLVAAMAHPQIVEASIRHAQSQWGSLDRQMLHTASGFLPTKAGQQINIDNRKQTLVAGGVPGAKDTSLPGLPSFEQDCIEGAEVLRGDVGSGSVKRLPAPKPEQEVVVPSTPQTSDILDAEPVD